MKQQNETFLQFGSVYRHSKTLVYWTEKTGLGVRPVFTNKDFLVLDVEIVNPFWYPGLMSCLVLVDSQKLFLRIDEELAKDNLVKLT